MKLKTASTLKVRMSILIFYIAYIGVRQFLDYQKSSQETKVLKKRAVSQTVAEAENENENEAVKVHGVGLRFTKTDGGKVKFGFFHAFEFWLPAVVKVVDLIEYRKYGSDLYVYAPPEIRASTILYTIFCLIPALELGFPEDWSNPSKQDQKKHKKKDWWYKYPLYIYTVMEIITTVCAIREMTAKTASGASKLSLKAKISSLFILAVFNGGLGITASHELIHKKSILDTVVGYLLLCNVNYMHWAEEHITGHHETVATPNDPATSELNESVYSFLPKTIFHSFLSANRLEQQRLRKKDEARATRKGIAYEARKGLWKYARVDNRMLWNSVLPFVWAKVIARITRGGWAAVGLFYAQGVLSSLMLEVINYIEHYGLQREKLPDGTYEPVDPTHSWNSPHRISNALCKCLPS